MQFLKLQSKIKQKYLNIYPIVLFYMALPTNRMGIYLGTFVERVSCMERVTWKLTLPYVKIDSQWEICCLAQETQTGALYQTTGVEWGGGSKGRGYMYTYG